MSYKTYNSYAELKENVLGAGDTINIGEYRYRVDSTGRYLWGHNCQNGDIFTRLNKDKSIVCENAYRYPPTGDMDGFPMCKHGDFAALTRLALFLFAYFENEERASRHKVGDKVRCIGFSGDTSYRREKGGGGGWALGMEFTIGAVHKGNAYTFLTPTGGGNGIYVEYIEPVGGTVASPKIGECFKKGTTYKDIDTTRYFIEPVSGDILEIESRSIADDCKCWFRRENNDLCLCTLSRLSYHGDKHIPNVVTKQTKKYEATEVPTRSRSPVVLSDRDW